MAIKKDAYSIIATTEGNQKLKKSENYAALDYMCILSMPQYKYNVKCPHMH